MKDEIMNDSEGAKLLEIKNLKTYFKMPEGLVRAVDGVSLNIILGKTLGVVGESGCGKSITSQSILRIVPSPGKIIEGQILYARGLKKPHEGNSSTYEVIDLTQLDPMGQEIRDIRGAEIAMIFQEPMTSLSLVYTIGAQIIETIQLHQKVDKVEARKRAIDMLQLVGLPQPRKNIDEYPFRLSGGMRQRAMIAMALCCNPSLLIADEPTTALDVTTQAQILELIQNLRKTQGMSIMYITHDLGVIAEIADNVVVMYLGRVVEDSDVDTVFNDPLHPYTKALLKSIPKVGYRSRERLDPIEGSIPNPYSIIPGCSFHPRCPSFINGRCNIITPEMIEVKLGHRVSCHLYSKED
jgi:peptide/nickel transport system ATP-binding protein